MSSPDRMVHLRRWAEIMSRGHGYAGVFNHQTTEDKDIVELSTADEWCNSVAAEFNLSVAELGLNRPDPPDCYVIVGGKRLGVELVQLVERMHKQRAAQGETPFAGRLFADMQWSKGRLVSRLNDIILEKSERYDGKKINVDVLLIHTGEPWLTSKQAQAWLEDVSFQPTANIANAFLLFDYEPGMDHWPVLRLFGDLGGTQQSRCK